MLDHFHSKWKGVNMFKLGALIFTLSTLAYADANQVYGKWLASQGADTAIFDIQPAQTILTHTCRSASQSVTVSITVPSQVTDSQYLILGSRQAQKSVDGLDCTVSIGSAALDYQVSGNILTLIIGGQSISMIRQ